MTRSNTGKLIILSGPSGCGKGTIVRSLMASRDDTVLSVSMTTRLPREGEQEGVHYFFRTREEFEKTIAADGFFEYAEYNGNYYGTPVAPVQRWLDEGKNVILEIEVQGAEKVMHKAENVVSVFIIPPSLKELEDRLRSRGTETEEVVRARLHEAQREFDHACNYQYLLLNDDIESATRRLNTIIDAESMRYSRIKNTLSEVINNVSTQ